MQETNKEHFTSMSVSGLKKYQIKPLFKVIFTLVRGNWKAGAYGNMDERLDDSCRTTRLLPWKKTSKEVQRVNDSGSTLIAAIAKYSPSCLLMFPVPPKLTEAYSIFCSVKGGKG